MDPFKDIKLDDLSELLNDKKNLEDENLNFHNFLKIFLHFLYLFH